VYRCTRTHQSTSVSPACEASPKGKENEENVYRYREQTVRLSCKRELV